MFPEFSLTELRGTRWHRHLVILYKDLKIARGSGLTDEDWSHQVTIISPPHLFIWGHLHRKLSACSTYTKAMDQPLQQFHHSYTSPTRLAILFTVMLPVASNYKCFGLAAVEYIRCHLSHQGKFFPRPQYSQRWTVTFNIFVPGDRGPIHNTRRLDGPQGHSRHSSKAEQTGTSTSTVMYEGLCLPHFRWLGCWFLSTETRTQYACTSCGRFLSHAIISDAPYSCSGLWPAAYEMTDDCLLDPLVKLDSCNIMSFAECPSIHFYSHKVTFLTLIYIACS
jgi:hypothetical protein